MKLVIILASAVFLLAGCADYSQQRAAQWQQANYSCEANPVTYDQCMNSASNMIAANEAAANAQRQQQSAAMMAAVQQSPAVDKRQHP